MELTEPDMVGNLCYVTKHAKVRVMDMMTIDDPGLIGDLLEAIHLHIQTLVHQLEERKTTRCFNNIITVMKKAKDTNRAVLITTYIPNSYLRKVGLRYGEIKYGTHKYSKYKELEVDNGEIRGEDT